MKSILTTAREDDASRGPVIVIEIRRDAGVSASLVAESEADEQAVRREFYPVVGPILAALRAAIAERHKEALVAGR